MVAQVTTSRDMVQALCARTRTDVETSHILSARLSISAASTLLCDDEVDTAIAAALARAALSLNEALALLEMRK